jgi:hypothetical protein
MSYILDALKKSERQRPPGPVPDLFTVQGPRAPETRRRPPAALAAALLSGCVLLLGIGAWFVGRSPREDVRRAPVVPERLPRAASVEPPAAPIAAATTGARERDGGSARDLTSTRRAAVTPISPRKSAPDASRRCDSADVPAPPGECPVGLVAAAARRCRCRRSRAPASVPSNDRPRRSKHPLARISHWPAPAGARRGVGGLAGASAMASPVAPAQPPPITSSLTLPPPALSVPSAAAVPAAPARDAPAGPAPDTSAVPAAEAPVEPVPDAPVPDGRVVDFADLPASIRGEPRAGHLRPRRSESPRCGC